MMDQSLTARPASSKGHCPTCGKPGEKRWRPFCSKRCADVDLGHWFGESYRIRMVEIDDDEEDMLNETGERR